MKTDDTYTEKIRNAPRMPGVYTMRDKDGQILYIGKAKDLRSRTRAYFGGTDMRPMVPFLMARMADIDFIVTETEKEALILENNLIKRHRPRYNVYFRDDKTYFNLMIDLDHPFPRFQLVRRIKPGKTKSFGPYPSSFSAKETLRFLQPLFPLRTCRDDELKGRKRPCLEYEIGRCLAPCVDLVSETSYQEMVRESIAFLEGRTKTLLGDLRRRMETAAAELRFEEAAKLRDRMAAIEATIEKQRIVSMSERDQDVFGFYREGDLTQVCLLEIRQGKLLGKKTFPLAKIGMEPSEILSATIKRHYDGGAYIPGEIVTPVTFEDEEAVTEWLSERKGKRVAITHPQRGQNRELLDIAMRNAEDSFRTERLAGRDDQEAMAILRQKLKLKKIPATIECFDISNIGGRFAVGSMVVFKEGKSRKQDYRRFRIRTVEGSDDYGMIYEVLKRRYAAKEHLPDLIVIDGGKGHLSVALSVLKDLAIDGMDVVSLAKASKEENEKITGGAASRVAVIHKAQDRVYLPHKKDPVYLSRWPAALFMLQRIRDEAHRFAIAYHRKVKEKADLVSIMDAIPGIGRRKKAFLLKHFGGTERIRDASVLELQEVPGIGQSLAEAIHHFFRNLAGGRPPK
jgi:excinuclease ABC subunit C